MGKLLATFFICGISSFSYAGIYGSLPGDKDVLTFYGQSAEKPLVKSKWHTLIIWNIYKHKRAMLIPDLTYLSSSADLVLLQESMVDSVMVPFFERPRGFQWLSAASFITSDGVTTGVSTGSKFRLIGADYSRSTVREPIISTPKMVLYAEYPISGGGTLLVANIHGINFVTTNSFRKQIHQMYEAIRHHQGPMIVAGDFNSRNKGRWKVLNEFSRKLKLNWVKLKDERRRHPIDAVFVRGLSVIQGAILRKFTSSDHKPIKVKFSLK